MTTLWIKDVPEDILDKLCDRAAANHRTLQDELLALLTAAADGRAVQSSSVGRASGHLSVQEAWAIASARPKPPIDMPKAVDIIRAARDGR